MCITTKSYLKNGGSSLGRHYIVEIYGCKNIEVLNDLEFIRSMMMEAAYRCGSTVIGNVFHQFEPVGITGVVAISESHLSIHTWPEYAYAAIDVFTCGTTVDPDLAISYIVETLKGIPLTMKIDRGTPLLF